MHTAVFRQLDPQGYIQTACKMCVASIVLSSFKGSLKGAHEKVHHSWDA